MKFRKKNTAVSSPIPEVFNASFLFLEVLMACQFCCHLFQFHPIPVLSPLLKNPYQPFSHSNTEYHLSLPYSIPHKRLYATRVSVHFVSLQCIFSKRPVATGMVKNLHHFEAITPRIFVFCDIGRVFKLLHKFI